VEKGKKFLDMRHFIPLWTRHISTEKLFYLCFIHYVPPPTHSNQKNEPIKCIISLIQKVLSTSLFFLTFSSFKMQKNQSTSFSQIKWQLSFFLLKKLLTLLVLCTSISVKALPIPKIKYCHTCHLGSKTWFIWKQTRKIQTDDDDDDGVWW